MNEVNAYGGALRGDCPWYVERREDGLVLDRLARGKGCYVLTSHQMGKSSLLVRLMDNFRKSDGQAVSIDLAAIGRELDASQWYHALALRVAQQFDIEDEVEAFVTARRHLHPCERFSQALAHIIDKFQLGRLVLCVDEADLLRSLRFSPDELLESIHAATLSREATGPPTKRVIYCLFATVPPMALWRQPNAGTWELGQIVTLADFERTEIFAVLEGVAHCLLRQNELPASAFLPDVRFVLAEVLERIFDWTHGHPYLTQKLGCAATQALNQEISHLDDITAAQCRQLVDDLSEMLFTSRTAPDQDCHLSWVRHSLLTCGLEPQRVVEMLQRIRRGARPAFGQDDEEEKLIRTSVVCRREGRLEMRNRIYERVFEGSWLLNSARTDVPAPIRSRSATPLTRIPAETRTGVAGLMNLAPRLPAPGLAVATV